MNVLQAALLGLVQGLCEFLPVSSSGHLVLFQKIFGLSEGTLFFDTMLHVATLFAVLWAFRHTILDILRHPLGKLPRYVVLATVPTVLITLLLKDFFTDAYGGGLLGWGFLLTSLILFLTGRVPKGDRTISSMGPKEAVLIGAAQGLAVLPGVSRSGSTIAGGLFCGLDRDFAAEFSFLMSIPAILGAAVLQAADAAKEGLSGVSAAPLLVGMVVAFASGFFAIRWMLSLIKKGKLRPFAIYTLALGALVLLDQYALHVFF